MVVVVVNWAMLVEILVPTFSYTADALWQF
jgi:hypothetical protein